jgi:hypothetical protein
MQNPPRQTEAGSNDSTPDAVALVKKLLQESRQKNYMWLPDSIRKLAGEGPSGSRLVHGVFTQLLNNFTLDNAPLSIPASIGNLYARELDRIRSVIDSGDESLLSLELDVRQKDLAILTFRLIPVGAEFAEPWSAIWKRQVLTARASQFYRAGKFFILGKNGFSPYFQLHMHQESHDDFNEAGWMETYMRLAELLECNPGHLGWFSCSWLVDPALEQISPHLSYLRTVPANNGGAIFYMKDDPEGKTGALAKSRTRRRLFREGRYRPRIYLRVWPRDAAIRWWKSRMEMTVAGRR